MATAKTKALLYMIRVGSTRAIGPAMLGQVRASNDMPMATSIKEFSWTTSRTGKEPTAGAMGISTKEDGKQGSEEALGFGRVHEGKPTKDNGRMEKLADMGQ